MTVKQAVVFAILMEHNGGILNKSPDYIAEKLNTCEVTPNSIVGFLLDPINRNILRKWEEQWK